jgi:hypothetical protein
LWGTCVENLRRGDVVSYLHHLGTAHQEVQGPVAQGGVQTQGPKLNDELGGYYVKLHASCHIPKRNNSCN